jgi:hypothetical protein
MFKFDVRLVHEPAKHENRQEKNKETERPQESYSNLQQQELAGRKSCTTRSVAPIA